MLIQLHGLILNGAPLRYYSFPCSIFRQKYTCFVEGYSNNFFLSR
jgi:hypothetical protein